MAPLKRSALAAACAYSSNFGSRSSCARAATPGASRHAQSSAKRTRVLSRLIKFFFPSDREVASGYCRPPLITTRRTKSSRRNPTPHPRPAHVTCETPRRGVGRERGAAQVRRALVRHKKSWLFEEPKTARSRRTVFLPAPHLQKLAA